jgi:hypothetical protein
MNLQQILDQSPDIPGYGGGKWAIYSVNCCWWTSFPEDLGSLPPMRYEPFTGQMLPNPGGPALPCCPHCHSVLLQAPLEKFIEAAQGQPEHYGKFGIETFVQTHSRNSKFCRDAFSWYAPLVARRLLQQTKPRRRRK